MGLAGFNRTRRRLAEDHKKRLEEQSKAFKKKGKKGSGKVTKNTDIKKDIVDKPKKSKESKKGKNA